MTQPEVIDYVEAAAVFVQAAYRARRRDAADPQRVEDLLGVRDAMKVLQADYERGLLSMCRLVLSAAGRTALTRGIAIEDELRVIAHHARHGLAEASRTCREPGPGELF